MTEMVFSHRHLDVVCELSGSELRERGDEWLSLRDTALAASERIPGGARMRLRMGRLQQDELEALVRRESECCGFLDLKLTIEPDIEITSPVAEAASLIEAIAGL